MKFIKKLNFTKRLYLMLMVPMAGVLFFAVLDIYEKVESAQDMKQVTQLAQLATKVSAVVHETQKERGATAVFMGSHGASFQKELLDQRAATDRKIYKLNIFLPEFNNLGYGKIFTEQLIKLRAEIDKITELRRKVSKFRVSMDEAINQYSYLNSVSLDLIAMLPSLRTDSQIAIIGNSYVNFLKGKERAGIERAVVSGLLSTGKTSRALLRRALLLGEQQDIYFSNFSLAASAKRSKQYRAFQHSDVATLVAQYRRHVVDRVASDERQQLLSKLYSDIGYGGAIHNFKNYVLRQQNPYYDKFLTGFNLISQTLVQYQSLPDISKEELKLVLTIKSVFEQYYNAAGKVEQFQASKNSVRAIDTLLKIDDQPAIYALQRLSAITEAINFNIDAARWFNAATARINGLKVIEDGISSDLINIARDNRKDAINSLVFYACFICLVFILTYLLMTKLYKSRVMLGEKETQLNLAKHELVQSEKIASLGRMVAGFAHEVNTPIGIAVGAVSQAQQAVRNFENLLQQEEVEEQDLIENIDTMAKVSSLAMSNLNRAARLVKSFKRTSIDQTSEQTRDYVVQTAIDDVLYTLNNKFVRAGITVTVDCPADVKVHGQPGLFDQLVTNLLLNSFLHGFSNGAQAGHVDIKIDYDGDNITMLYQDNGLGMTAETLDKIFEPFFTTNRSDGSGLGMYICYSIVVEEMKGLIRCSSIPGQGVLFEVVFPAKVA